MSGYYNDEDEYQRRKSRQARPVYEEEIVESRRSRPARDRGDRDGGGSRDLIKRRDDDSSSTEEIPRDFPPGDATYVKRKTKVTKAAPRARSTGRYEARSDKYSDSYAYSDRDRRSRRSDST